MYYTFYTPNEQKESALQKYYIDNLLKLNNVRMPRHYTFPPTKTVVDLAHNQGKSMWYHQRQNIIDNLQNIVNHYKDIPYDYNTFKIPKASGGFRTIDAPNPQLKALQQQVLHWLKHDIGSIQHNAAFAYTQHRSTKDALLLHQQNKSNWFLKIDIKNFFPSITEDVIRDNLKQLYPLAKFPPSDLNKLFETLLPIVLLNGSLPQGSPVSPHLSNLVMVPFDYEFNKALQYIGTGFHVYTRYADDILISHRVKQDIKPIIAKVEELLDWTGKFKINKDKLRYGSKEGRNWNLGLMYNKDSKITVGHKAKQLFRAELAGFIRDYKTYTVEKAMSLQGILAYYKQIEPEYIENCLLHYERKFNLSENIPTMLKKKLS